MAISASMVKELREKTGAGMMDCKKALTNTDGDMDKAVEWLRENGLAKAEKKAGRIAAEGIVKTNISEDGKKAAIVEVNSETDFVAKNEKFQDFVAAVADQDVYKRQHMVSPFRTLHTLIHIISYYTNISTCFFSFVYTYAVCFLSLIHI